MPTWRTAIRELGVDDLEAGVDLLGDRRRIGRDADREEHENGATVEQATRGPFVDRFSGDRGEFGSGFSFPLRRRCECTDRGAGTVEFT